MGKSVKKTLVLTVLCLFFACQQEGPVFTLTECFEGEYADGRGRGFYSSYTYYILVRNAPNDKEERKRLLIRNIFDVSSPVDSLQSYSNVEFVSYVFLKSTIETKLRFRKWGQRNRESSYIHHLGEDAYSWYKNKTYIGDILITRCEEDKIKQTSSITVNLGTTNEDNFRDYRGPARDGQEDDILLNECEPDWHVSNKGNELAKLFGEYYKRK